MSLYIVSTPIGNLEDISKRALRTLSEVDLILCEDTRVAKKLLERYSIKTKTLSFHQHSKMKKIGYIVDLLKQGKNLALVSDSGTPGISDPGAKLITEAENQFKDLKVIPIPGPSAVTAAASISGFPMDKFIFLGFPPNKRKRKKFFKEALQSKHPIIFYESPFRILKTLKDIQEAMGESRKVVVCRELTKKFETVYRGEIGEVIEKVGKDNIKGEFVVVLQ
ncbi:16S rRNA (cytidine(1402)-2'-O)-methyltransferase [Patescibacteria group bacterium]